MCIYVYIGTSPSAALEASVLQFFVCQCPAAAPRRLSVHSHHSPAHLTTGSLHHRHHRCRFPFLCPDPRCPRQPPGSPPRADSLAARRTTCANCFGARSSELRWIASGFCAPSTNRACSSKLLQRCQHCSFPLHLSACPLLTAPARHASVQPQELQAHHLAGRQSA